MYFTNTMTGNPQDEACQNKVWASPNNVKQKYVHDEFLGINDFLKIILVTLQTQM